MYLSNIKLWNFRKYGEIGNTFDLAKPNLDLNFTKGLNVLIGENDSGKTAIIDAIKLVLKTHSYDYIKVEDKDFFESSSRFRIELEFSNLTDDEAKNFTEWLGWKGTGADAQTFLKLNYDVTRNDKKINPSDVKAGADSEGYLLTAEAKEYLKTTYLRPLRDAENELVSKRNSRLSQILLGDPTFRNKDQNHELVHMFEGLNTNLKKYFKGEEISFIDKDGITTTETYEDGKAIKDKIDGYIKEFYDEGIFSEFNVSSTELKSILEKFSLFLESQRNVGLGTLNRLFMAAELLHLNKEDWHGLRLGLIEELEAHLHPQAQMQVIEALQRQTNIQLILSTHSPNLASKVKLENLILCNKGNAFPLGKDYTMLQPESYKYLEIFLDTTKSNLFFAKGVIFVEGWAEEILIPSIAKAIGKDLTAKGVSVVNIGGVGFQHFVNIFLRKQEPHMNIPIVVITDSDIRTYEKVGENYSLKSTSDTQLQIEAKLQEYEIKSQQKIKYFIAKQWTLEYCLFKSSKLSNKFKNHAKAIHSRTPWDTNFELELAKKLINKKLDKTEISYRIAYDLDDEMKKDESERTLNLHEADSTDSIYYLIEAIRYVTNN
ncbi:AAA family ATPase [Acinetobacter bereziniae]|uniref:ATP-dependent nuclease n=1 Tax=Acinetobacter bereziniae TaxID=106648 RepID=UPI0018FF900C|nr:AAA family ATPase [Acinetobacter bereziniae]MBJ8454398.1 AAA family ATPase [Acinetobacter bereziniae]MBJ8458711.1 AAA family ATPase [Acinetobacter bereziniae]